MLGLVLNVSNQAWEMIDAVYLCWRDKAEPNYMDPQPQFCNRFSLTTCPHLAHLPQPTVTAERFRWTSAANVIPCLNILTIFKCRLSLNATINYPSAAGAALGVQVVSSDSSMVVETSQFLATSDSPIGGFTYLSGHRPLVEFNAL
jgi:hypothetical protein